MKKHVFIFKGEVASGKTSLATLVNQDNTEIYDDVILTFENGKKYAMDVIESKKQNHIFIIANGDDYISRRGHSFKAIESLTDRLGCAKDSINISIVSFKRNLKYES